MRCLGCGDIVEKKGYDLFCCNNCGFRWRQEYYRPEKLIIGGVKGRWLMIEMRYGYMFRNPEIVVPHGCLAVFGDLL